MATVLYMSMSLDGFIAGPNETDENGLGDGGDRLHEWVLAGGPFDAGSNALKGANRQVVDEFMATGAIVAGRGTFEPAGGWGGDHHDGVPIWIYSRHEPGIDVSSWPLVTYVNDIADRDDRGKAGRRRQERAGPRRRDRPARAGCRPARRARDPPRAGAPRPGAAAVRPHGSEHIELERTRVLEGDGGVTHLHYRVRH